MAGGSKTVLVVEDEADLREMVEVILSEAGYRVITAGEGQEALEKVAQEMPTLILLDMRMPGMNGWEFVRAFRAKYEHLAPIVVFAATVDARKSAAELGTEGSLGKPFEVKELLRTVERHVDGGDGPTTS